eukprot:1160560-Pelagomonas_calceolata.AAC.2
MQEQNAEAEGNSSSKSSSSRSKPAVTSTATSKSGIVRNSIVRRSIRASITNRQGSASEELNKPTTYKEAESVEDAGLWKRAMDKNMTTSTTHGA